MALPKPAHLGEKYALQFSDPSVAAAYRYRLPYPAETYGVLKTKSYSIYTEVAP